jgi:hypothetical protein
MDTSTITGYGAAAIKAGDQRYSQAIVNLMQATQAKPGDHPSTIVQSTPAASVGRNVDVRA